MRVDQVLRRDTHPSSQSHDLAPDLSSIVAVSCRSLTVVGPFVAVCARFVPFLDRLQEYITLCQANNLGIKMNCPQYP